MSISYFILEKGIIERDDLSIYEKMCCVVLAKWAAEEREGFDTLTLAREMSCTEGKATETILKLKQKGFIQTEGSSEAAPASKIIKAEHVEGLAPINFAEPNKPMNRADLMAGVQDIIDEPINDSEARIILNFAGDDLDKVKRCYKVAKNMQISDTIEALIIELQRKEKPPATLEGLGKDKSQERVEPVQVEQKPSLEEGEEGLSVVESHEFNQVGETLVGEVVHENVQTKDSTTAIYKEETVARPWYLDDEDDLDAVIKPPSSTQINTHMIHKMKAYKKYGK